MDKIIIKDLKLFAYHGVHEEEKMNGQNFITDITVYLDLTAACVSDNVNDTVSYSEIIKTVTAAFKAEKYDLIEKAAAVIADTVLEKFPSITECDVLLKKPEAPIKAEFGYVAVEIRRKRNG
ncbi:MAG: dihydroneopterin aldolase [Clostridia bacterium]|nr:dihydroneopterin aldolase [Clostridia bacterium]MBQ9945471.1 dihydroneopterin aldolase [Clostridia bacterium]